MTTLASQLMDHQGLSGTEPWIIHDKSVSWGRETFQVFPRGSYLPQKSRS